MSPTGPDQASLDRASSAPAGSGRPKAQGTSEPLSPVYLVQGSEAPLVDQELSALLARLGHEPGHAGRLLFEEHSLSPRDEEPGLSAVLDACRTLPFLAEGRLVVARDAETIGAAQAKELTAYLADPLETTILVLVAIGKGLPASLARTIASVGVIVAADPGTSSKARGSWITEHVRAGPVRLDPAAISLVTSHLGEDLDRLDGILSMLQAAYGSSTRIGAEELRPFLGVEGGMAPWDLTDALDAGDSTRALRVLGRLIGSGRHPLQVLSTIERHYMAMLRLDGLEGLDAAGAASLTKLAPYPAGKALRQSRVLGHDRLVRAIRLLAAADLDLRGVSGLPAAVVCEVLVARLAQLPKLRANAEPARRAPARGAPA